MGSYALIIFHDENGNSEVDHNLFRFPAEPLGYSNGFRFTLLSGMPTFNKLRFEFTPGSGPLEIKVE